MRREDRHIVFILSTVGLVMLLCGWLFGLTGW
jgi:hypothetical protein